MQRFVQFVTGGGLSLVAGLWLVELFPAGSPLWLLGVALSLVGVGALALGIWIEIELV